MPHGLGASFSFIGIIGACGFSSAFENILSIVLTKRGKLGAVQESRLRAYVSRRKRITFFFELMHMGMGQNSERS